MTKTKYQGKYLIQQFENRYLFLSLDQNSQTSGVILEDFDTAFTNNFYHSHLDDLCKLTPNLSEFVPCYAFIAIGPVEHPHISGYLTHASMQQI